MRKPVWVPLIFLFFAVIWPPLQAQIVIPDPPRPRRPVLPVLPMEVRALEVEVNIENGTALTSMRQVFYNPGSRMAEATFLLPLPQGAAISSFTMLINGVETPAELLNAEKAKNIYTEIVRRMQDPALLEYLGGGLLRARVFPVEARSEKEISVQYRQVLESDDGLGRYRYPLSISRLGAARVGQFTFSANVHIDPAIKTLYSPSHDLQVQHLSPQKAELNLKAKNFSPDRDLELLFSSGEDAVGLEVLAHAVGGERYFWVAITPSLETERTVPKDIAFVIDTSGSMAGLKLEKAKKALSFCIANLNPEDRLAIIRFSTESESFEDQWIQADNSGKKKAEAILAQMEAMGGTNIGDALAAAFALPLNEKRSQAVVLLTDGKPTIGETREDAILGTANQNDPRRVFSFGIGDDINIRLLDKLAEQSGGWRTYARPDAEIELALTSLFTKISAPVLISPKLKIQGITASALAPMRLPDLFKGNTLHVFGRYEGSGRARIELEGLVEGRVQRFETQYRFPRNEHGNSFIPALWAQRRVGFLLDQIRLNGEDKELVDEVVKLAKKHGIVTPYTSYLILEDEDRRTAGTAQPEPNPIVEELVPSRREARDAWRALDSTSGRQAVVASEEVQQMVQGNQFISGPGRNREGSKRKASPIMRQAAGRAFFQTRDGWTESQWLDQAGEAVAILFASEEYFDLLERYPELKPILALGRQVRFIHGGQRYVIGP